MTGHSLEFMQKNLAQVKARYLSPDECKSLDAMLGWATKYAHLRSKPLDTISTGGVFAGKTPENCVLNGEDLDREIEAEMAKVKE